MPWKTTRRPSGPGGQGRDLSIDLLGAAPATAIKNSAPVIPTLLAALLYGEQVTPLRWAAVVAIVAGIALVIWRPGSGVRQWLGPGALYAVGAALSYGVRPLFLKFGLDAANIPLTAACIGAFAALVCALAMGDRSPAALRSRCLPARTVLADASLSAATAEPEQTDYGVSRPSPRRTDARTTG